MPSIVLNGGARVTAPETFDVVQPTAVPPDVRRASPIRTTRPVPLQQSSGGDDLNDALLASLGGQDLRLTDTVELQPRFDPTPPSGRRSATASPIPAVQTAHLDVDVSGTEGAVVLLEQDGVYTWVLPSEAVAPEAVSPESPGAVRRGPGTQASGAVRFEIPIQASRPATREPQRGLLGDILFDRVKAYVLKYVARLAVEYGIGFLERHIEPGLVTIGSVDSSLWVRGATVDTAALPKDRAAQVLLLVHGTFSSTVGGFGALSTTPWGREMLQACLAKYDAVLGFDHRTLSEDPGENAQQILTALQEVEWGSFAPHIDAVAHSRGGLVLRSLADQLLSQSNWKPELGQMVLVGATNGGTELANEQNWKALADLYTNMAMFACRALSLIPGAGPVGHIAKEVVSGVGSLVKYLASSSVGEDGAPGLSAMSPQGKFISTINLPAAASDRTYCVITSEFAPRIISETEVEPKEMPLRFAAAIAEGLVTQLMKGAANDIVVDTRSMSAIHPAIGHAVRDALNFGNTPLVYHTNYFSRPEVTNALARWFVLPAVPKAEASEFRTRGPAAVAEPASFSLPPAAPLLSGSSAPAGVDTDVIVTPASATLDEVLETVVSEAPSFVIVKRPFEGEVYNYAFTPAEMMQRAESVGLVKTNPALPINDSLDLHEYERVPAQSEQETGSEFRSKAAFPDKRTVVMRGKVTVGLVPAANESVIPTDLAELARVAMQPSGVEELSMARRAMPTLATAQPETRPENQPQATCYFHASMREQTAMGQKATVTVSVSREELVRAIGRTSVLSGPTVVDTGRKLLIQVFPKSGWELVDDDGPIERDVPEPGQTDDLYFELVPTAAGAGEIWVVIRQRQVPLATLKLFPMVVEAKAAVAAAGPTVRTIETETRSMDAPLLTEPLHQLTILEQKTPDGTVFHFELRSEPLKLLKMAKSKVIATDQQNFVDNIYHDIEERWVSTKGQAEDFEKELQDVGASLLRSLVPSELQQILWDSRDKLDSIFVVSEEPFIPWELVYLTEPGKPIGEGSRFLGEMGLVRWLYEADAFPPVEIRVAAGRAFYVVPDYPSVPAVGLYPLPEATKEKQFLIDRFQATEAEPQPGPLRNLLTGPGAFDLLHFACHGMAASENINEPQLVLKGEMLPNGSYSQNYLRADTVESRANTVSKDGNRPIVVVNACQAGRATYKLTGIGGFAQAFLSRGAGCFVGTLWSVTDSPARTFTEGFYGALLGDGNSEGKGDTIAVAARKARETAKQSGKKTGDSTWLSYVVYGHPHARLVRR